mmetsp:Transcript_16833/g.23163  ORF Transcript_16833/g.23163 Transcript_16833/m.23163 type:complete len:276 (+) Transcript_16833:2-829(+)
MYKGKKFNSKKEDVEGDTYMGIKKFRFYIKCSVCSAEITFKTDPKNADYECESGASRNFEVWRDNAVSLEEDAKLREEEDKLDAMKALENRTIDNKVEMDVLDALDEIKAINQRHERIDTNQLLASLNNKNKSSNNSNNNTSNSLNATEEELLKQFKAKKYGSIGLVEENTTVLDAGNVSKALEVKNTQQILAEQLKKQKMESNQSNHNVPTVIIKKKRKIEAVCSSVEPSTSISTTGGGGEGAAATSNQVVDEKKAVLPAEATSAGLGLAYDSD